jgi:hypothetical protein
LCFGEALAEPQTSDKSKSLELLLPFSNVKIFGFFKKPISKPLFLHTTKILATAEIFRLDDYISFT